MAHHWPRVHTEAPGLSSGRSREGLGYKLYWSDTEWSDIAQCRDLRFATFRPGLAMGGKHESIVKAKQLRQYNAYFTDKRGKHIQLHRYILGHANWGEITWGRKGVIIKRD